MLPRTSPWALARTAMVIGGLAFAAGSLAIACLDHFDEDYGECALDGGLSDAPECPPPSAATDAGSGSGSATF